MLQRIILLIFLFMSFINVNAVSKNDKVLENEITGPLSDKPQPFDVLHYDLVAIFKDPATKHISGTCKIYLKWIENQHENKFLFHLRSLNIDSAFYDDIPVASKTVGEPASATYHHEITTPEGAVEADTHVVRIHYSGIMTNEGGSFPFGGVSASGTSLFSLGVGFQNNYVSAAQHWMPCYDHPMDKATFRGKFIVPYNYFVASNGLLELIDVHNHDSISYIWNHNVPCSTYLLCFAADHYATVKFGDGSLPIEVYAKEEDTAKVRFTFRLVPKMVEAFEKRFGLYPFEKVGYATTLMGSMEHQTMISYARNLINILYNAKDSINYVAAHELAHQWFGDLVTCRDFRDAWLNESFATYCESIWAEDLSGYKPYLNKQSSDIRNYFTVVAPSEGVVTLYDFPRNPPSSNYPGTIYQKGSVVLGMLRYELGDEIFFRAILEYLNRYKYGNANTDDLKNVLENVSGKDLDWFFRQWIYGKGWPKLNINIYYYPYNDEVGNVQLSIKQVQSDDYGIYINLPLEIGFVKENNESIYRIIKMTDSEEDFWLDSIPPFKNVTLNQGPSFRTLVEINSLITSVSENYLTESEAFIIYPNPATTVLNVSTHVSDNKAYLNIFDTFGKKVLFHLINLNPSVNTKLDISFLPAGVYTCTITQNGSITNSKIQIIK